MPGDAVPMAWSRDLVKEKDMLYESPLIELPTLPP
jgi:hypothetical protein